MKIYDLSTRNVLRWESFREDQHRFDRDLIQRLHFRQMYIPKTKWQIRKANAIRYTKKGTMSAMGIGLCAYFVPMDNVKKYLLQFGNKNDKKKLMSEQMEGSNAEMPVRYRTKRKKKRRSRLNGGRRWKSQLITVAVVTSVFTVAGYYVYDRYRLHHQTEDDDDDEEQEGDANYHIQRRGSVLTYLLSLFSPRFSDEHDGENDFDSATLTPFQFLNMQSPKVADSDK